MSARPHPPAHPRLPLVERSWFEPAILLVLVVIAGLAYAWYTGRIVRTLGPRNDHFVAAPTTR